MTYFNELLFITCGVRSNLNRSCRLQSLCTGYHCPPIDRWCKLKMSNDFGLILIPDLCTFINSLITETNKMDDSFIKHFYKFRDALTDIATKC